MNGSSVFAILVNSKSNLNSKANRNAKLTATAS